jgi:hypothetical protein
VVRGDEPVGADAADQQAAGLALNEDEIVLLSERAQRREMLRHNGIQFGRGDVPLQNSL